MEIDISVTKRGKGYWKLNNKLLNDHEYCKRIEDWIDKLKNEHGYLNDIDW